MIYPLTGRNVAVLVIDAQEEYFDPEGPAFVPGAAAALIHVNAVIEACHAAGQLVVYIRHAHNPDGSDLGRMADFASPDDPDSFIEGTPRVELTSGLTIVENAPVISKTRYDSFAGTGLHQVLGGHG